MRASKELSDEILPTHLAHGTCYFRFAEDGQIFDAYIPCRQQNNAPEVLQRSLEEILPDEVAAAIRTLMKTLPHERERTCLEYSQPLPDREHTYEAQLLSLGESEFILLAYDQSVKEEPRACAEEVLPRLRAIFDQAQEGVFQSSADGHFLFVNPALAAIYGYDSPDELMHGITDIQQQLYADPGRRKEFARLVRKHGSVAGFQSPIRHREGNIIWISENARQVCDSAGVLLGYEGIVVDVTAIVNAKNQQRKATEAFKA